MKGLNLSLMRVRSSACSVQTARARHTIQLFLSGFIEAYLGSAKIKGLDETIRSDQATPGRYPRECDALPKPYGIENLSVFFDACWLCID